MRQLKLFLPIALITTCLAAGTDTAVAQYANIPPTLLQVPWLRQWPPGTPDATKNCGQTCSAAMCRGYFKGLTPTSADITAANKWLATRFNDNRYLDPNGYYTNFDGRNALGVLLTEFCGLKYSRKTGKQVSDMLTEVVAGRPVIAGCMISSGNLVSSGGVAHWCLVVGYDPVKHQVIVNDPGSSSGRFRRYNVSDFENTWATQGRVYAPVWK